MIHRCKCIKFLTTNYSRPNWGNEITSLRSRTQCYACDRRLKRSRYTHSWIFNIWYYTV